MLARWPPNRLCGSFSTARWWTCGSTARRPQSRCWSSSVCERMARKYWWRSRAWVGRAAKPGAVFSMISSVVACAARAVGTDLGHSRRTGEGLPVVSALVLLGAVGFTLVAAYQWAGRLGIFGEATTLAPGNWQGHVWQGHVWNTVFAILLWLVWVYG